MHIYLDILFLENFIINRFLLSLTAKTVKEKVNSIFLSLASVIGSSYLLFILIGKKTYANNIFFKLLVAFCMVFTTFRKKNIIFKLKTTFIFILYSILLAGICIFMQIANGNGLKSNVAIVNFPYKKLLMAIILLYLVLERIVSFIRDRIVLDKLIYKIDIDLKNSKKSINAFLDTGNELVEPVTNLPVIVVEKDIFQKNEIEDYDTIYIPFSVVNGDGGMLKAIKPEMVSIYKKREIEKKEVLIAFSDKKLSSSGDYRALLSRGIIF
ncbi:sigma-E processing peptidase SpoIIGA [Clostridium tetani]|uniref:Sporulation sigma-E factor-processing peptidase n=1 Tax=Clostridium tetani TaxID=1513 RepID=A0ABC8EAY9_CLOTA|nr:sigma-E processing peptidase SpoIIGA [Clostridium tetani]BDR80719.1 sigma-E processing peptidase SpoIIGA [Clostridium tetani]BDR89174.1 sigma-E processing peptidase SpoIIGA [Clostridium tetani]